jgi:hypothetical protein
MRGQDYDQRCRDCATDVHDQGVATVGERPLPRWEPGLRHGGEHRKNGPLREAEQPLRGEQCDEQRRACQHDGRERGRDRRDEADQADHRVHEPRSIALAQDTTRYLSQRVARGESRIQPADLQL